jgi:hypothetical protein
MENNNPTVKVKSLAEKAILVSINIGTFSVNKKDKKQSQETANNVGGSTDYIRVNKSLLRNKATAAVVSFSQKMRLDFYSKTAAWGNDGNRIIKISNYAKVKSELEDNVRKFYDLVNQACDEYQSIIDNDFYVERKSLGVMFNRADYPSINSFKESFYAKVNVAPVQDNDFRCNALSNEEIEEINKSIEDNINSAVKNAEMDVLNRVNDKLNHLVNRLQDFDSKFHTSNVSNVCEIIREVRELNINDNKKISDTLDSIEKNICGMDAENIRESDAGRADAIIKTKAAIEKISSVMDDFAF